MSKADTEVDDDETQAMFPELDDGNDKHKELIKAAKRFHKSKEERAELLSTAKEKQDADESRLVALCHSLDMPKFKHNGIKVEIIPTKERAIVKIDTEDEETGDQE
jgi:hypothetical protein